MSAIMSLNTLILKIKILLNFRVPYNILCDDFICTSGVSGWGGH